MTSLQGFARSIRRLALRALLVCAGILLVSAAVPLLRGSLTLQSFVNTALSWGFVVAAIGALLGVGRSVGMGTNPQYQFARTAGEATGEERARQDFTTGQPPIPFMLVLIAGGILAMLIGLLLKSLSSIGL